MNIRIVSWNIAGGRPTASLDQFDYGAENLEYFITEIRKYDPDIICLQEVHTPLQGGVSQAELIAKALHLPYIINSPINVSHIDINYNIGIAILSKLPTQAEKTLTLPNPHLECVWADGTLAYTHEKNIQVVAFNDFTVVNNHMLPITLFGYSYDDASRGGELARNINEMMSKNVPSGSLIWCGDFNYNNPPNIYPCMQSLQLTDSLQNEGTRPVKGGAKKCPDHIYCTREFLLQESTIEKTNTDHYLCFAEFIKEEVI